jgi:hypothetical protein
MARFANRRVVASLIYRLLLTCGCGGCSFGPKVLEETHGRYNEAVHCVYEEQLLRNIVHMRYNEGPAAVNVSSIAAQYDLSASLEARPFFIAPNPSNSNVIFRTFTSILPDAVASTSNRPTMTLDPVYDNEATKQFLTPIPLDTMIFLARTSWPVNTVLRLWVERMNGVPNASGASGPPRPIVPDFARFQRIAELMQITHERELTRLRTEERFVPIGVPMPAAAITSAAEVEAAKSGLYYRLQPDGKNYVLGREERQLIVEVAPGGLQAPEVVELNGLLNLLPGLPQYEVIVRGGIELDPMLHPVPPATALTVQLRSTAQVDFYLANGVEVPAEHIHCGLITPALDNDGNIFDPTVIARGLFHVHVCKGGLKPPKCAFVAIRYRGYWYYIDDHDEQTKSTFALMLQLHRLDFGKPLPTRPGPVLTLPAGR